MKKQVTKTIREQITEKSNFLVFQLLFTNAYKPEELTKIYQEKLNETIKEKDYESAFKLTVILEQIPIVCETNLIARTL